MGVHPCGRLGTLPPWRGLRNPKAGEGQDGMMRAFLIGWLAVTLVVGMQGAVRAQQAAVPGQVWVQIEAVPTLRTAEERARAYAGAFDDVAGFAVSSGWYAIVLGPYDAAAGAERLATLRRERLIPSDSFVADGGNFRQQYWPLGGANAPSVPTADQTAAVVPVEPAPPAAPVEPVAPQTDASQTAAPATDAPTQTPVPAAEPAPQAVPEPVESLAESRRAEAALSRAERQDIQSALQWFGFYASSIDGAFGAGSRAAISAWQAVQGAEPTGVLSTAQRAVLVDGWQLALAQIGLERVRDEEAGIEIDLPMGLVQFERYAPPFAQYGERMGSGVRVLLISQPGDQGALYGLYDMLQTLEVVPLEGPRERRARSFEISGRNAKVESYSYAELTSGLVKGFVLIWEPGDSDRMGRVLAAMKASFRSVGNRALDPGLVPLDDSQRAGMLTGLEPRRPGLTRSGFYIDARGTVMTTSEAVAGCDRITLDGAQEAEVALDDPALGIAVLRPRGALVPQGFARFAAALPREGGDVAVAGYSFGDQLTLPTLTFGSFAAPNGLDGQAGMARLTLPAMPGDAGGPVMDSTGAVIGVLLPRLQDAGRVLPADVTFAAPATGLAERLAGLGVALVMADRQGALAPEDITRIGTGMAVMVSCWR